MGKDGPEGLSVSQVAKLAGVNRGTAYNYFPSRDELIAATTQWVSERLCHEVFGETRSIIKDREGHEPREVIERLVNFAMANPEFCRVWLSDVLGSGKQDKDPFWKVFKAQIDAFVNSDVSQPGIDAEVHAVSLLVGVFLWPVWVRTHAQSTSARRKLAQRFTDEMLRMSLHGTLKKEKFPQYASTGNAKRKP